MSMKHDYANIIVKKLIRNFEAENNETPQKLEPEPKNGVAYEIKTRMFFHKNYIYLNALYGGSLFSS